MATLYTHKSENIRKTWFLMGSFLILVIALGWVASYYFGDPLILYIAVGFSLIMNGISFWQSDKIALATSGAKPADEREYRELHRMVENLAITAGLPKPRVYVINDSVPNAFATGRNPEHAAIAVTTGLMNVLDRSELEGVLAHELAHVGNRDILVMSVAVVLAGFVTLLADLFIRGTLFGGGSRDNKAGGILMIVGLALLILSPIFASLIQFAVSRKREFLADASGALLTRYPEGLARALEKISSHSGTMKKANHATAHLFISNPFGSRKKGAGFGRMFMTHPPIEERVAALRGMQV